MNSDLVKAMALFSLIIAEFIGPIGLAYVLHVTLDWPNWIMAIGAILGLALVIFRLLRAAAQKP